MAVLAFQGLTGFSQCVMITPGGPTSFCAGGSVVLTSSEGTGLVWSTGETTQSIVVNTAGSYSVTVNNGNCTGTSDPVTVTLGSTVGTPLLRWQRASGGSAGDWGESMIPTADGGSLVCGSVLSSNGDVTGNHGDHDVWLVKYDAGGVVQWSHAYGGSAMDMGTDVVQMDNGDYVFTARVYSNNGDVSGNHGASDIWVARVTSSGTLLWQFCYGSSMEDMPISLRRTADGGFVMGGQTIGNDGNVTGQHEIGKWDIWVVKLSASGALEWQKTLGGNEQDNCAGVVQLPDGGYAVAGSTNSNDGHVSGNHGDYDFWLTKLSSSGTLLWQQTYGGSGGDLPDELTATNDGGFLLTGYSSSTNGQVTGAHGLNDVWVVKTNAGGVLQWQRTLGGTAHDYGHGAILDYDGGYLIGCTVGSSDGDVSDNHGGNDMWLVKLDPTGAVQRKQCFGGTANETLYHVARRAGPGVLVCGYSYSSNGDVTQNQGGSDLWAFALWPPAFTIVPSGPTTFPVGGGVQLTSSVPLQNRSWSTGDTSATITVTQAGTYQLTGTTGGCTGTESITVNTVPLPTGNDGEGQTNGTGNSVGYTQGNFSVSETGTASYSIPIVVSPGTGGVQPGLSLAYNSNGGNGPLGMGWTIQGLSMVSRSSKTVAVDGISRAANMDSLDTYSLDGERLVVISNTPYGANGAEYRTEQNTFSRIISYGSNGGSPVRWKVWTKGGNIMSYGATPGSSIEGQGTTKVLYWLVDTIADRHGNYMVFSYEENNATGVFRPLRVDYTGNSSAGLMPYNHVQFVYEDRPDIEDKYVLGCKLRTDKRLAFIRCYSVTDLMREYRFNYAMSQQGYVSLLATVQECAGNGICYNPTTFQWETGSGFGFYGAVSNVMECGDSPSCLNDPNGYWVTGDWNGDGQNDALFIKPSVGSHSNQWFWNKGGYDFANIYDLIDPSQTHAGYFQAVDFNTDGYTDLVQFQPSTGVSRWYLNRQKEFGFNVGQTFQLLDSPNPLEGNGLTLPIDLVGSSASLSFGDLDADGRVDAIWTCGSGCRFSDQRNYWFRNNGNNTFTKVLRPNGGPPLPYEVFDEYYNAPTGPYQTNWINFGDWNGDGRTDVMFFKRNTPGYAVDDPWHNGVQFWYTNKWNGTTLDFEAFGVDGPSVVRGILPDDLRGGTSIQFVDLNADGNTDIIQHTNAENMDGDGAPGSIEFFINKGDLHFVHQVPHNLAAYFGGGNIFYGTLTSVMPLDVNGDGFMDLFTQGKSGGLNAVLINKGYRNDSLLWEPHINPFNPTLIDDDNVRGPHPGSWNGDGVLDFLFYNVGNGGQDFHRNQQTRANFIKGIRNGHGSQIDIEYKALWDTTVYTRGNQGSYPDLDFIGGYYVVSRYGGTNGIGGKSYVRYKYKEGIINVQGRGFRGYKRVETYDETTGMLQRKFFTKDPRYITVPLTRSETWLGTTLLSEKDNKLKFTDTEYPNHKHVFWSFADSSLEKTYDVDGSLIATTRTVTGYDAVGNATLVYMDHGEGHRDSTISQYTSDATNWILSRLSRADVYKKLAGKPDYHQAATFEYNATTGQLTKEVSFPDSSSVWKVEKTYAHDAYGNILQSATTAWNGQALETRTLATSYDAPTHRFEVSTTNVLGHTETSTYDPKLGKKLSTTGPNGLTTTYVYDAFGRVKRQDNADSSWTRMTYVADSLSFPGVRWATITESPTSPPSIAYYDALDRTIATDAVGFNGEHIRSTVQYDARGQAVRQSDPYFGSGTPVYTVVSYDTLGRKSTQTLPGNRTYQYSYEAYNTTETNPLGQTSTIVKNTLGQVLQSIDNLDQVLSFEYDAAGNLLKSTDPEGNQIINSYNGRNDKVRTDDPDMGVYQYRYNSFGELIRQYYPAGDSIRLQYDLLGRLVSRTETEGLTNWTYDIQPHGIGKLASLSGVGGYQYTPQYDALGRPVSDATVIGGQSYATASTFDFFSRKVSTVYPTGFAVKNLYNANGYLHEVRAVVGDSLYWKATAMNARQQLTAQELGNGLVTNYEFDPATAYLLGIHTETDNNEVRQDLSYGWNNLGNLIQRGDALIGRTEHFEYDDLNRLLASTIPGLDTVSLSYDGLGNITSKSDVGTYTYGDNGAGPHQVTSIDLADTNICIPSFIAHFKYTSFNKVREVEQDSALMRITYGPDYQRIRQETLINGVLKKDKVYIGGLYEKVVKDGVTSHLLYIHAANGVVAVRTELSSGGTRTEYWSKDHLNSLQLVTGDSAQVLETLSYDAWGQRRNADWGTDSVSLAHRFDRGFTGHEHLDLFALVDMNGRIYDPVLARFTTPDPFIQYTADLQSYNRYSYVMNNPLSVSDPSGYFGFGGLFKAVSSIATALVDIQKAPYELMYKGAKEVAQWTKENWRTLAVVAVGIGVGMLTGGIGAGYLWGAMLSGAITGFATAASATLLNGGSFNQAMAAGGKGALIGAVSGAASFGVGEAFGHTTNWSNVGEKMAAHGVVQGGVSEWQGGQFKHGFVAGTMTAGTAPVVNGLNTWAMRVSAAAVVGGTSAQLTGGKFVNGAVSGAFVRMFNDEGGCDYKKKQSEALKSFGKQQAIGEGSLHLLEQGSGIITETTAFKAFGYATDAISFINDGATFYYGITSGNSACMLEGGVGMFTTAASYGAMVACTPAGPAAAYGCKTGVALGGQYVYDNRNEISNAPSGAAEWLQNGVEQMLRGH